MNQTWRGRALGCPPVSVRRRKQSRGRRTNLYCVPRVRLQFTQEWRSPNSGPLTTNYRCSLATIVELRQFWRVMRRLLAELVLLATALSLAAQNLPGVPAGKPAPHSAQDQFAKEQTLSSLMGPPTVWCSYSSARPIGDPSANGNWSSCRVHVRSSASRASGWLPSATTLRQSSEILLNDTGLSIH